MYLKITKPLWTVHSKYGPTNTPPYILVYPQHWSSLLSPLYPACTCCTRVSCSGALVWKKKIRRFLKQIIRFLIYEHYYASIIIIIKRGIAKVYRLTYVRIHIYTGIASKRSLHKITHFWMHWVLVKSGHTYTVTRNKWRYPNAKVLLY